MSSHPEHVPIGRTTAPSLRELDSQRFARHMEKNEKLLAVIHRHPLALAKVVVVPLLGMFIGLVLAILFAANLFFLIVAVLVMLGSFGFAIYRVFDWYYDAFLLTDQSVLLLFWDSPFHVKTQRVRYEAINSVTSLQAGLLATVLDIGTVTIHSPSGAFPLSSVYRPEDVQEQINKVIEHKRMEEMKQAGGGGHGHDGAAEVEVLKEAVEHLVDEAKQAAEERRGGKDRRES